jgi:CxxC-x17-CxxC domain-containing protein
MALEEKTLRCRDCEKSFIFTIGEQEFYSSHGLLNDPRRCPECRQVRHRGRSGDGRPRDMYTVNCADCGIETQVPFNPKEGRPVYCRDCYLKQRNSVQLV